MKRKRRDWNGMIIKVCFAAFLLVYLGILCMRGYAKDVSIGAMHKLSLIHILSRHIEHSELTEASLNERAFCKPESIEEEVSRNMEYELLHRVIEKLPEVQRRRLLLYFFGEMTYEQIAAIEGCTKRAVKFSVDIAIEKLKKDFGTF